MATWIIDPDHSVAAFSVGHMMINLVRGQFNRVAGSIILSPPDLTTLEAQVYIEADSIYTGIAKRDAHLKRPDFLDTAQFPHIVFKSSGVRVMGIETCLVSGFLSIHGVTHPVELDVQCFGPITSPDNDTSMGFAASARLNREKFGLTWNVEMDNHGFMVGKELTLILNVEADLVE